MDYTLELIITFMSRAMMLLLVLPVINYSRGMVAKKHGDDTSEQAGRLTLNPMVHLDMLGSLMILLIGFGWSKPMPINYNRMKNSRKGVISIAITGPVTLFLMSILCKNIALIVSYLVGGNMAGLALAFVFSSLGSIATCLGVIHLLPFPGMDGFTLLYYLSNKFAGWYHRNQRTVDQVSFYLLLFLFFVGRLTRGALDPLGWLISLFDFAFSMTTLWIPIVFG